MEKLTDIPFYDVELPEATKKVAVADTFPLPDIMSEVLDDRNLTESIDYLIQHLENKHQREHHNKKKAQYKQWLTEQLTDGTFSLSKEELRELEIYEGGKHRKVHAPPVYKRCGVQAIMRPVEAHCYPTLIDNTAASIKGRGMHWLHRIIEEDLKADPEHMKYYGQSDIIHFYDNIIQELMKECVRRFISDTLALKYIDNFITVLGPGMGLSKGLRSSQCLANLFLSDVDHEMCQHVRYYLIDAPDTENGNSVVISGSGTKIIDGKLVRYHYYRYCDDIVFITATKEEAWLLYGLLKSLLEKKGLQIKPNFAIRPMSEGLDFLGYVTFLITKRRPDGSVEYEVYSRIRKRIKKTAARKLAYIKSRKRRQQVVGSFKGMACHADCKHLYLKLTNKHMSKFSELGLRYQPKDGKKRFNCSHMTLGQIANRPIEILEFEKDIKTRFGDSRYVVLFHFVGEVTEYKFYTDSEEMKSLLDQMEERKAFPVETTIKQQAGTGALRIYQFT